MTNTKEAKRIRRHVRVRKSIATKNEKPRVCVHRSNRYITGQLIDDSISKTVASSSSKGLAGKTYVERSFEAGKTLAAAASKLGISEVIFDRGGYLYTGRVKAFAEGAREGGLKF